MKQYVVDAFTEEVFKGNQAAVCVMEEWLDDKLMQKIAIENNFSETAFTVKNNQGGYDLRWFTPGGEINLCGHATLATSYILFRFYEKEKNSITFHTLSGDLFISKQNEYIVMDFPTYTCHEIPVTRQMEEAMGERPIKAYLDRDLLLVYENDNIIRNLKPDFEKVKLLEGHGVGVTAPSEKYDCVSRFFAPKLKVNEDPVTGSIHCMIAPYWANKLNEKEINAYQASKRGGELLCKIKDKRVEIYGKAVLFAKSEIYF